MKKIITLLFAVMLMAPLFGAMAKESTDMHHPKVMVNDVVQSLAGTWTGQGTMKDMKTNQDVSWTEHLRSQPTLNNKFLMTETTSEPNSKGDIFQGKGFMTYDPLKDKYQIYWFDTMGFGGKFEGEKDGNVINLSHNEKNGDELTLTMTLVSPNKYQLSMHSKKMSGEEVPMMNVTYTRVTAQDSRTSEPVKVNTGY